MKNPLLTRSNQKTVQLLRFKTLPSDSFLDWNILTVTIQTAPPANSNNICCKIKFMNFLRNLCFDAKRNHLTQVSF